MNTIKQQEPIASKSTMVNDSGNPKERPQQPIYGNNMSLGLGIRSTSDGGPRHQTASSQHLASINVSSIRRGGVLSPQYPPFITSPPNVMSSVLPDSGINTNSVSNVSITGNESVLPAERSNISLIGSISTDIDQKQPPHSQSVLNKDTTTTGASIYGQQQQQPRRPNSNLPPARTQFCQFDILACINCTSGNDIETENRRQQDKSALHPIVTTARKLGPLLLDLRRLLYSTPSETNTSQSLFTTSVIAQSRGNPSLGTSVSSTCLAVSSQRSGKISANSLYPPSSVATGLSTGALCIHSFVPSTSGMDNNVDSSAQQYEFISTIDYYQFPRNNRPATAVAWRPNNASHVTIGYSAHNLGTGNGTIGASQSDLLLSRTIQSLPQSQFRRNVQQNSVNLGGGGLSSNPAALLDRQYCCFLWDVEHQAPTEVQNDAFSPATSPPNRRTKTDPLYKLSHNTGVASMNWILDDIGGQILAIGGQTRTIQIFDLRVAAETASISVPQTAPISVYGHSASVNGIEADPTRPWHFCSYSHAEGEVVKIWDARRMESPLSEIRIGGNRNNSVPTITNVQWSGTETGQLSILVGDDTILKYDTFTNTARPVLASTLHTMKPIVHFSHSPYYDQGIIKPSISQIELQVKQKQRVFSEILPKEIVVIDSDLNINVVSACRISPIQISPRTGQIIHTLGQTLWFESVSDGKGAVESSVIKPNEDISATMLRRARCMHTLKYSMDVSSNIELLISESTMFHDSAALRNTDQLVRLWRWIQLCEGFCHADGTFDDANIFSTTGLIEVGAVKLLDFDKHKQEQIRISDALSCKIYDSDGRRAVLASCGWAGVFNLSSVMTDCESRGDFERSAALAVWHEDIGAAVDAFERGATIYCGDSLGSTKYAETLEQVSLLVAGFQGSQSSNSVWRRSCEKLLQRPDLSDPSKMPGGAIYLRHILKFLLSIGIDESYTEVVTDLSLSVTDRVAFSCRFLSNVDLKAFIDSCVVDCKQAGNVEGIVITGLEKHGIQILQSYVDETGDVQTAALVTSRVILPMEWATERRIVAEWLHSYRFLLNRWQMWQSRAMFDVDRASLLRFFKSRQRVEGAKASRSRQLPRIRTVDSDVQATVPVQLDARCNYCSSPLGLRQQESQPNQWLSKMKNVIPCCPKCRKPLPRCAICMLTLGAPNPYYELTKDRPRGERPQSSPLEDLSTLANLPFAEWFSWCMRCKHGGHAHHLVSWFAKHEICPVSGCSCRCQFDGIRKLHRPGMGVSQTDKIDQNTTGTGTQR